MRSPVFFKNVLCFLVCIFGIIFFHFHLQALAEPSTASKIKISGNRAISADAILNMMAIKPNTPFALEQTAKDIKSIFASGYFQDVQLHFDNGDELTVSVIERPIINKIDYQGFNIVSSSSLKDKITSKKYTIIDDKKLSQDLRSIEQAYIEKGYYLAKASYTLQSVQPGSIDLIFNVTENDPISVRKVNLIGNWYFSDSELQAYMATRPLSWSSFFTSTGLFRDEYVSTDQQNLTYIYRDNGFAEAVVTTPLAYLDKSKVDIGVSFYIEQGERFHIGNIKFTGDLLQSEDELKEKVTLKEGELYRISKFNTDMKILKNIYGDEGYAFAYVYPAFHIDRVKKTYDIDYNITKGEKAYFRHIIVEGNVKTRDNVIRRAVKVSEGELFNATKLDKSKTNIERLGFFESVDLAQDSDPKQQSVDLKITVKEKSTGTLSASLGASPNSTGGTGVTFFGQLQYQEKNLIGKAYGIGANLQASPSPEGSGNFNYTIGLNFSNPSVYDSPWSFGINGNYSKQVQSITTSSAINQLYLTQKITSGGVSVGREIIENLRFSLGYSVSSYESSPTAPLTAKFYQSGKTEEISQTLTYDNTNNYLNPTSGTYLSGTNAFGSHLFIGEYRYGSASATAAYYLPISFTDSYKTNFRFAFQPRFVYQLGEDSAIPYWQRLKLGGPYYMKAYSYNGETIAPTIPVTISPVSGQTVPLIYGGNRSFYGVAEYFVPIIPEAGLRFVTFGEAGTVLDDYDSFTWDGISYDVGFGFRWVTPVAPFRFEWAFPIQNGQVGTAHFVFSIGYDSLGAGT